jgi:hypothetical protein
VGNPQFLFLVESIVLLFLFYLSIIPIYILSSCSITHIPEYAFVVFYTQPSTHAINGLFSLSISVFFPRILPIVTRFSISSPLITMNLYCLCFILLISFLYVLDKLHLPLDHLSSVLCMKHVTFYLETTSL